MPSGGRGSLSGRGGRAKSAKHSKPVTGPGGIVPIYKRLPHGPHRLPRHAVVRHQRTRIHGAMIEAVARAGYERTSVKEVIGLAGVSRRSFYELFANKQECFLATFDVIAGREIQHMANAYRASKGGLADRMGAAYEGLAEQVTQNPKAATLAFRDAQTVGAAGILRLRQATGTCERMLARSLDDAPDAASLPAPIVRGIVGGLHGALGHSVGGTQHTQRELGEGMLHWTISFQTPGAARMDELLSAGVRRRMRAISLESAHTVSARPDGEQVADERSRLMHEVLRLALHDYRALTAPQIADEANVPIDAFLDLFATPDECYLAALETISEQLLGIAEDPGLSGGDWPVAVRHGVSRLLSHLGAHPLQARTIGQAAFTAGPDAVRRTLEITEALARRLTDSAPAIADGDFAIHAIAGALMHTVRCQVLSGRIQLLGVLSDHLSYVVLAPYIGAEAALDVISTEASV